MAILQGEEVAGEVQQIGARLRELRARSGWTLDDLARRSSLSKSYLSRLEEGSRQASIAALLSVSRAFGLPIGALFGGKAAEGACTVVRAGAPLVEGNGLRYAALTSGARRTMMQPVRVTVPHARKGDELYRHEGEEWLFVLSGTLQLRFDGEAHDLEPGDSAYFDASRGHRLEAVGDQDAEVILVACATPPPLLESYR